MKFRYIKSYDKISTIVDGPYNDPRNDPSHSEDRFELEYEKFRRDLILLIDNHCVSTGAPRNSIHVGHRTGFSRGIGIVMEENSSKYLIGLIEVIRSYLHKLTQDYCVAINLVLDEYGDFKDLSVGITKSEEILVHADKAKWFREVGIDC
jgi:hypothetical protein